MAVFQKKVAQLGTEPKPCDWLFWADTVSAALSIHFHSHTYIHTYTPPKVFRALLSISLNGPKIISQGRVQESSRSYRTRVWRQTIHIDAMYVCMGGLGCLFAAESNGIVQSLLRVISRRLRVVEWTWSWTLEAAPLTRRTI